MWAKKRICPLPSYISLCYALTALLQQLIKVSRLCTGRYASQNDVLISYWGREIFGETITKKWIKYIYCAMGKQYIPTLVER